jgi:hypothetical protein
MRGGDLVGSYLITQANPGFPAYIKTPQGYHGRPGFVIQAMGNLCGFPPAGQNFSIEFDKCLTEAGYKNTPWDLKLFLKWTAAKKPMIIIAHSEDFRWFGPEGNLDEWDNVIKIFSSHRYQVTDATDKELVGIKISRDEQFNYYMDQHRMTETIISVLFLVNIFSQQDPKDNSTYSSVLILPLPPAHRTPPAGERTDVFPASAAMANPPPLLVLLELPLPTPWTPQCS